MILVHKSNKNHDINSKNIWRNVKLILLGFCIAVVLCVAIWTVFIRERICLNTHFVNSPPNVTQAKVIHHCLPSELECDNGACINIQKVCNDVQDCENGDDENRCVRHHLSTTQDPQLITDPSLVESTTNMETETPEDESSTTSNLSAETTESSATSILNEETMESTTTLTLIEKPTPFQAKVNMYYSVGDMHSASTIIGFNPQIPLTIIYGERITFICEVTGNEPFNIQWYFGRFNAFLRVEDLFETLNVQATGNHLEFKNITMNNSGNYSCVATNSVERPRMIPNVEIEPNADKPDEETMLIVAVAIDLYG